MTELGNIKAAIASHLPVLAMIDGAPSVIIGYDDEKQQFLIRPCGGKEKWVPYSTRLLLPLPNPIMTEDYYIEYDGRLTLVIITVLITIFLVWGYFMLKG